jgi:hypothetical protein
MTKELNVYRAQLINQLVTSAVRFREVCLEVKDPYALLEAGDWTVHQVAVHTRDVHQLVYEVRARQTAETDNPEFPNFDSDVHMMELYDRDEPLVDLLDRFVENVESFAALLRALPVEAWSRESRHAIMGSGFTLQTWVERDLAHIEEHIDTIKKGI